MEERYAFLPCGACAILTATAAAPTATLC